MIDDFVLISKVGSKLFSLDTDSSDSDYIALTCGDSNYNFHETIQIKQSNGFDDYFISPLDSFNSIIVCASPFVAPSYDAIIGGSSDRLKNFIRKNSNALADIYPLVTYNDALNMAEFHLALNDVKRSYKIAVRLLGMMWCRYYTGDLLSARQLTPEWRDRYFAAKRGELDASDIMAWYNKLNTPSIQRYFSNEPKNTALHDQYKKIIDQVIKEESE